MEEGLGVRTGYWNKGKVTLCLFFNLLLHMFESGVLEGWRRLTWIYDNDSF